MVWCALAAAAGVGAGMYLPDGAAWACAAAAAVILLLILRIRPRGALLMAAAMAGVVLLYAARMSWVWTRPLPPAGEYTAQGVVLQAPNLRENGQHVSVCLRDVTLTDAEGNTGRLDGLYWTAYVQEGALLPEPGRTVRVTGRLYAPSGQRNPDGFDFRLYLRQNHMSAGLYNSGAFETVADAPWSLRAAAVRLRYRLLGRLDEAFGERSALPKALLLGERYVLSEQDRTAFARLGIAHVLAVSGLHISLIVAALGLLLKPFLSARKQLWLFGAFLVLYALLLDLRASVVRAAVLTFVYLYLRARGRSSDPLSALALAAMLILLVSPTDLTSAGFQLSFAAAGGIVLLDRPVRRVAGRFLGRRAGGLLSSTFSAVAGTALPMIQTFHYISPAGFIFSPLACALLAYLLPLCLAVLALALIWMPAARWLALPVGWVLKLLSDGVSAAAEWPFMSVNCPSVPWPFWPLVIAAVLLFSGYAPARWRGRRRLAVLGALLVLGSAVHLCTLDNGVSYLQLDVGSADCAVIQDGRYTAVVDCGDDGRDLCDYLLARGRSVDLLVLTHLHLDHCLGAQALMDDSIPIKRLALPAGADRMAVSAEALELLSRLREYCGEVVELSVGDGWRTERTSARVLWPERDTLRAGQDANDYCLCLEYRIGSTDFLLMSDLTGTYEPYVRARADILKVAHHGSLQSSTEGFLASAAPRTALISVSANADAARPEGNIQTRLREAGADVYTTADCGAIRIEPDTDGYRVIRYIRKGAP